MPKVDLRELWEGGIALDNAWIDWGLAFDRATWRILNRHPSADGPEDPQYAKLGAWLPDTLEKRQMKLRTITAGEHVYLLDRIYSGEFWAIGCMSKPKYSDEFVRVPRHLFFVDRRAEPEGLPDVTWARGEIRNADEAYFDVRVVRPPRDLAEPTVVKTGEAPTAARVELRRRTKPSTYSKFRSTVLELKSDPDFMGMARREDQARYVRAKILGHPFKTKDQTPGYHTETLVKWLGKIFGEIAEEETE